MAYAVTCCSWLARQAGRTGLTPRYGRAVPERPSLLAAQHRARGVLPAGKRQGTALIGGKLSDVYLTYFSRKWSLAPASTPASACSTIGALEMGGQPLASGHPCDARLLSRHRDRACPGRRRGNLKITGSPVTVKQPPDQAKAYRETLVGGPGPCT